MCFINQNQEACNHPECLVLILGGINCHLDPQKERILESLLLMIMSRNTVLNDLCVTVKKVIEQTEHLIQTKKDFTIDKESPKTLLLKQENYIHKLCVVGEAPSMVLKEKGFELNLEVHDMNENKIYCEHLFKVKLFTNEIPPKPLKLNIASKKILRGTIESYMNSTGSISFDNIVINEVSSHYINESFTLIVSSDSSDIKPLIIESLYVRARNSNKKSNK